MTGRESMRLTDTGVGKLKPAATEYIVWDSRVAGLGVRVRPSGHRSYVWHGHSNGTAVRLTVGSAALMTVEDARRECLALRNGVERSRAGARDAPAVLALLGRLPCRVMISGYPSALYDEHLAGWRSLSLQVMNQAGVVTEKLWFNFAPDRLHWARFAGRNFTDRQRIKRRAESWGRRYRAMPPAERLAVLAAMMAVEAG